MEVPRAAPQPFSVFAFDEQGYKRVFVSHGRKATLPSSDAPRRAPLRPQPRLATEAVRVVKH